MAARRSATAGGEGARREGENAQQSPSVAAAEQEPEVSELTGQVQRVLLPLVLSPVIAWILGFLHDNGADTDPVAVSDTIQKGVLGEAADTASNDGGPSNFLFLARAFIQAALTCFSFYQFWEILRRDFVPRFLMPSTTKTPALFAMRAQQEDEVESRVNSKGASAASGEALQSGRYRRVTLEVHDPETNSPAQLECSVWEHPPAAASSQSSNSGGDSGRSGGRKWILYLNANGVAYQDILPFTIKYAQSLQASVLHLNYRGVQGSTGRTTGSRSLFADAERGLQYLLNDLGVKPPDILVHGHSMGGAIALVLASRFASERLKCVADRTFSRLQMVIHGMLNGVQGLIFGIIFTVAFSWIPVVAIVTCAPTLPDPSLPYFVRGIWIVGVGAQSVILLSRRLTPAFVQKSGGVCTRLATTGVVFLVPTIVVFSLMWIPVVGARLSALLEYLFLCDVCGGILGYLGLLRWPLTFLAELMDWGINPQLAFQDAFVRAARPGADSANVLVIAHPNDGIVPYSASLYVGLGLHQRRARAQEGDSVPSDRQPTRKIKSILLSDPHPNCHMMHLDTSPATWFGFLEVASRLLYR